MSLPSCSLPVLCPRSYQSVAISRLLNLTYALKVTKVSLLSCPPPVLLASSWVLPPESRLRSYQSVASFVLPSCLATSKLPKCRYLLCPPPAQVGLCTSNRWVFVPRWVFALSKLPECRYLLCSPLSRCVCAHSKLSKCHYLLCSRLLAFKVTKV